MLLTSWTKYFEPCPPSRQLLSALEYIYAVNSISSFSGIFIKEKGH